MSTESIIGLVVALAGVNLVGVIGAAWALAGKLATIMAKLEPLEGIEQRVTRLETQLEHHGEILDAAFQMVPMPERH